MPRELRKFEIGRIYHLINRGVDQRNIFLKNQDYQRFILGLEFFNSRDAANIWELIVREGGEDAVYDRLRRQREKEKDFLVEILAFVLMPSHFHFIVREITEAGITAFMRKIGGYVSYFNKQNQRVGTLFQGRYRSVEIKDDSQLSAVFNYVHTNPVELIEPGWKDFKVKNPDRTVERLKRYRWSSYLDYIGETNFPFVTSREFFLNFFGNKEKCAGSIREWILSKGRSIRPSLDLGIIE